MNLVISEYNKDLPQEAKEEILHRNFESIRKILSGISANTLLYYVHKTARAITSASFVDIPDLAFSFESSGGIVTIDVDLYAVTSTGSTATFQLLLDGLPIAQGGFSAGGAITNFNRLRFKETLVPGTHKLQVQAAINAGATVTVSSSALWSKVSIEEVRS